MNYKFFSFKIHWVKKIVSAGKKIKLAPENFLAVCLFSVFAKFVQLLFTYCIAVCQFLEFYMFTAGTLTQHRQEDGHGHGHGHGHVHKY